MILIAILFFCFACFIIISNNIIIKNIVLKSILSLYFSITILSFCYFISLTIDLNFIFFEILCIIFPLIYLVLYFIKEKKIIINLNLLKKESFFVLTFVLLLISIFSYNYFNASIRWGGWDAWAIWSLHAKMLVNETYFRNLFVEQISWTHSDYPLFLPSNIALIWKSIGVNSAFVPAIFAFVNAVAIILTILTSFIEKRQLYVGLLLFSIIIFKNILFPFVVSQQADTVLALFILISFVLLQHLKEQNTLKIYFLIGFFVASSAWIKNEGIVFFFIFSNGLFFKNFKNYKLITYYCFGTLLPLLVLIFFKTVYAPSSDLLQLKPEEYLSKLCNFENYVTILEYAVQVDICKYFLALLITVAIINYKYFYSFCFLVICGLLTAYFFIYVTTPNDLVWHLKTSLNRLFHHITPVLFFSVFITIAEKLSNVYFLKNLFKKQN